MEKSQNYTEWKRHGAHIYWFYFYKILENEIWYVRPESKLDGFRKTKVL